MDEFARMMLQEGVRPLGQKTAGQNRPGRTEEASRQDGGSTNETPAPAVTTPSGPAWKGGADARRTLEAAIDMAREDRIAGAPTWITGLRQDGRSLSMRPEATLGEIVSAADREDLRLITIAGRDWTCILHPSMGIATIEHDAR
ncbi:hypothetical protein [uncultured Salinicola sp.]|uniref:hypothetical protein n=1 Tax=uncultured Salinicola sp. TaxID=1193542 RepID=UPI002617EF87|nr:hypothetical protein [uncultured Salinicola sp.]|tara:strand:- start:4640 stop:5071 length:432 start_codon:yes stop_codon:yes gene_type:complete